MHKLVRVVRSIVIFTIFCAVLTIWILGAMITIRIDQEKAQENFVIEARQSKLMKNIDNYCRQKERINLLAQDVRNVLPLKEELMTQEIGTNNILNQSLIYIDHLEQMWCLVPKAASTSWSRALIENLDPKYFGIFNDEKLTNSSTPLQIILKNKFKISHPQVYNKVLDSGSIKKILLIRHPFGRIVSAYEDKLKNRGAKSDSMYFYRNYGVKIKRRYRPLKALKQRIRKKEPTFEEFIDYLIQTDPKQYDEHWQPISIQCGLCEIKYDHVVPQEDLENFSEFHLNKLGFSSDYQLPQQNRMGTKEIAKYFQNIPRRKMVQLFSKYKDDFLLFNYNFLNDFLTSNKTGSNNKKSRV